MAWVGRYASENGFSAVLHAGDIFHVPDIANNILSKFINVIKNYYKCPIFAIPGNHDLFGNNSATLNKTALGILFASGLMLNVDRRNIRLNYGRGDLIVTGSGSRFGYDSDIVNYIAPWAIGEKRENDILLNLAHGSLFEKETNKEEINWETTSIDDILRAMNIPDIIVSGHIHTGFKVQKRNNTWFANPGALARLTSSVSDINLKVKMLVIDISEDGEINMFYENLPEEIAFPINEVIDLKKIQEEKRSKNNLNKFVEEINKTHLSNDTDLYKTLETMANEEKISEAVQNEIREQLERAEQEIKV